MSPAAHRVLAWLCLALMTLSGLIPAQGVVLCIEEDGRASIEMKSASSRCAGCPGNEAAEIKVPHAMPASGGNVCPCVDIAVPGSSEAQNAPSRSAEPKLSPCVFHAVEIGFLEPTELATAERVPPLHAPRVADSLACIRSVILLV
jgi:hypothetical protein